MIRKNETKKLFRETFYLIIGATIIACIVNLFHPRGFKLVNRNAVQNTKVVHLSVSEAKVKFDAGIALFIDARDYSEYAKEHIRGGLNIPASPASLSVKKIEEYFTRINGPKELVIYCDSNLCDKPDLIVNRLQGMGYKRHLYIIAKGFPIWKGSGYPVESKSEGVEADGKN